MKVLTHDLEQISGGTAQYDAGYAIGSAFRSFCDGFVRAGILYTPTL